MVEQAGFPFDPEIHQQPPPVVPLREAQRAPRPQPQRAAPQPPMGDMPNVQLIEMAKHIRNVLATRVLLLVSIVVASAIWGVTSWQPTEMRIIAASTYCILLVWPLVWLLFRKG